MTQLVLGARYRDGEAVADEQSIQPLIKARSGVIVKFGLCRIASPVQLSPR